MATDEQRARRRAQRATAKAVQEKRKILPRSVSGKTRQTAARIEYARKVANGDLPAPKKGTAESRNLGSLASFQRWGKLGPDLDWLSEFERFWYKDKARASRDADNPQTD